MNFVRKITSKGVLCALDFGAREVCVLIAERRAAGLFEILGAGRAEARGVDRGEITHVGDAVEAVVAAVRQAEHASGLRVEKMYFNLDDPAVEGLYVNGSKHLAGEGEIRAADLEEAAQNAERLAARFDRTGLYAKPIEFVIDEHDKVADPVGAFGKRLDVVVHCLQARSELVDRWNRVLTRADIRRAVPVLSALSSVYGVLRPEERDARWLVVDAGEDVSTVTQISAGRLTKHRALSGREGDDDAALRRICATFRAQDPALQGVILTGDRAAQSSWAETFARECGPEVRVAGPWRVPKLDQTRHAALAGLLEAAEDAESREPFLRQERGLFVNVKEKALAFIQEYF